jgi:hypothetical protein
VPQSGIHWPIGNLNGRSATEQIAPSNLAMTDSVTRATGPNWSGIHGGVNPIGFTSESIADGLGEVY